MSRYRKIEIATWTDSKLSDLSRPLPNAQSLWFYLLCGPRTTVFPGVVLATEATIASDLGWPLDRQLELGASHGPGPQSFREVWREISVAGMAVADWRRGLVVLPRALFTRRGLVREASKPGAPNVISGWLKAWWDIPECRLRDAYQAELERFCEALGKHHLAAYYERLDPCPKESPRLSEIQSVATKKPVVGPIVDSIPDSILDTPPGGPSPVTGTEAGIRNWRAGFSNPVSAGDPDLAPSQPTGVGEIAHPTGTSTPATANGTRRGYPPSGSNHGMAPVGQASAEPGSRTRASRQLGDVVPDPELVARRELGDWGWNELNAIRSRVATTRGWRDVRPLHPMDPGRTELAARLRESGASGGESLRHVLAIAEAEAIAKGTVEYLTGSLFEPVPWRKKLAMRTTDAGRVRGDRAPAPEYAGARAALERERESARARAPARDPTGDDDAHVRLFEARPLTDDDRAELRRLARQFNGLPPAPSDASGSEPADAE